MSPRSGKPGLIRFQTYMARIQKYLVASTSSKQKANAAVKALLKDDVRNLFFKWEALTRVYGTPYPELLENGSSSMICIVKENEDALGRLADCNNLVALGNSLKLPVRVMSLLETRQAQAHEKYLEILTSKWFANSEFSVIPNFQKILLGVPWKNEDEDSRIFVKSVLKKIKKTEALALELTAHLPDAEPRGLKVYEKSMNQKLHDFRRQLRWILLYIQASNGLVILGNSILSPKRAPILKLHEYSYLANHPMSQGPFAKIVPNPQIKHHLRLPQHLFLALSKIVTELGEIKSQGENVIGLAEVFLLANVASEKNAIESAEKALRHADLLPFDNIFKAGRSIFEELRRTQLLREIRRALKRSLDAPSIDAD